MAVVQYSGLLNGIKGKMGGSVFQEGPAGWIIKNNSNWNKLCSNLWQEQKAKLGNLAQQWRALDQADRDTWIASAVDFPFTDKFGNTYTGSGYQVFMSLNRMRLLAGQSQLDTIPMPGTVFDTGTLSYGASAFGPQSVTWVNALGANDALFIYASRPQSAGQEYRRGQERLITIESTTASVGIDIQTAYEASFGVAASGSRLWVRTMSVLETNGQHGSIKTADFIVP